jgi:hypothetical protein
VRTMVRYYFHSERNQSRHPPSLLNFFFSSFFFFFFFFNTISDMKEKNDSGVERCMNTAVLTS